VEICVADIFEKRWKDTGMSDTDFGAISRRRDVCICNSRCARNIEIVDDVWIKDSLSDDEIDVPKDTIAELNEDEDEEFAWDTGLPTSGYEVWGDLGLDHFLQELTALNVTQAESFGLVQAGSKRNSNPATR